MGVYKRVSGSCTGRKEIHKNARVKLVSAQKERPFKGWFQHYFGIASVRGVIYGLVFTILSHFVLSLVAGSEYTQVLSS